MQLVSTESRVESPIAAVPMESDTAARESRYGQYKIIRRNGAVVGFEPGKISVAMTKAFLAVNGSQGAASARVREQVAKLTEQVVTALMRRQPGGGTLHIEDIQDQVELALMRSGEHDVARAYVLYREERARLRAQQKAAAQAEAAPQVVSVVDGGVSRPLDLERLQGLIKDSCEGLGRAVEPDLILQSILKDLYNGVPMEEVRKGAILSARALIEKDPAYAYVTARLLLNSIQVEVLGEELTHAQMRVRYAEYFPIRGCALSTCAPWGRPWTPTATSSSAIWACRPCTTATSSTCPASASSSRRPSSCGWPWGWR
jgi:ribonucleoside-diphosphate reductase alpha chain